MTYAQLIQDAYEDIGWLSKGKALDGHDTATAFRAVERILDLWSSMPNMTPSMIKRNFQLTSGQNSYTIGGSGSPDSSDPRPIKIHKAFIRDSAGNDYSLACINVSEFSEIADKDISQRPTELFYLPTVPNGTIYFDSDPTNSTDYLHYFADEPITAPTKTSDTITLAPAFKQALLCKLRLQLATKKHMPVDPAWWAEWKEAKAAITTRAAASRKTSSMPDISSNNGRDYNILSDY